MCLLEVGIYGCSLLMFEHATATSGRAWQARQLQTLQMGRVCSNSFDSSLDQIDICDRNNIFIKVILLLI